MITLNEFVAKFASEFDETPVEKFTPSTVYEEFDKFLTGADLRSVSTIEELYGLIQTK